MKMKIAITVARWWSTSGMQSIVGQAWDRCTKFYCSSTTLYMQVLSFSYDTYVYIKFCVEGLVTYVYMYMCLQVREHFLPPLLDAILGDYRRNVPEAREPEVLSTVSAIVDKLEVSLSLRDCQTFYMYVHYTNACSWKRIKTYIGLPYGYLHTGSSAGQNTNTYIHVHDCYQHNVVTCHGTKI